MKGGRDCSITKKEKNLSKSSVRKFQKATSIREFIQKDSDTTVFEALFSKPTTKS